jgi:putative PEP-CTERM system TPR-repeat lipoprotein
VKTTSKAQTPARQGDPAWRTCAAAGLLALTLALPGCDRPPADPYAAAQQAAAAGNPDVAIVFLRQALQADPDSAAARLLLGQTLQRVGDPAGAAVELQRAQALGADANVVVPALALATVLSGQPRQAVERYADATLTDPGAQAALQATLAAAQIALGNVDAGRDRVDQALRLDPRNVEARVLRIRLLAGAAQAAPALAQAQQLAQDEPARPEGWQVLGELRWFAEGDLAGATESFERALAAAPAHLPAHLGLLALAQQRNDTEGFRARLAALRQHFPQHAETRFHQAQLDLLDGRLPAARDATQALLRDFPDAGRALHLAGLVEHRAGNLVQAEGHLAKAVHRLPESAQVRVALADTQLRLDQAPRALATLQPLLRGAQPPPAALAVAAQAQIRLGRYAEAEALFLRAARLQPDSTRAAAAAALVQLAQGRGAQALDALQTLAAQSAETYADFALVSARLARGEWAEALAAIERLLQKAPATAAPLILRAQAQQRLGQLDEARASLEQALQHEPRSFGAIARLVDLDVGQGRLANAIARLDAYLRDEPRNHEALRVLTRLELLHGVAPEQVEQRLAAAVRQHPGDAAPHVLRVDLLLAQNRTADALAAAQHAAAQVPTDLDVADALGRAQLLGGAAQQALATLGRVLGAQPNSPRAHVHLAQAHLAQRNHAAAEPLLRRALQIDARHLPAQQAQIALALARQQPAEAIAVARRIQAQRPTELVGYLAEAELQASLGRRDLAAAALRNAYTRRPETETAVRLHRALVDAGQAAAAARHAQDWRARHPADMAFVTHLGNVAMREGRHADAEALYRQAVSAAPRDSTALNNLAWALVQQANPEALPLARRAAELTPESPAVLNTLAAALALTGDLPAAIETQRRALARSADAPVLRLHLAELLIRHGNRSAARSELEQLQRLGERFAQHERVSALLRTL